MNRKLFLILLCAFMSKSVYCAGVSVSPAERKIKGGVDSDYILVTKDEFDKITQGNKRLSIQFQILQTKLKDLGESIGKLEKLKLNEQVIVCRTRESIKADIARIRDGSPEGSSSIFKTVDLAEAVLKDLEMRISDEKLPCF